MHLNVHHLVHLVLIVLEIQPDVLLYVVVDSMKVRVKVAPEAKVVQTVKAVQRVILIQIAIQTVAAVRHVMMSTHRSLAFTTVEEDVLALAQVQASVVDVSVLSLLFCVCFVAWLVAQN